MPKIERQRRIAKAEQIGRVRSFSVWLHLGGLILRCLMGMRLLLGRRKSMPFTALVESYCTAPYTAKGSLPLTCSWSQMVNSSSLCQKAIHMTASQILWGKRTVLAQDSFSKSFINNKWSLLPFSSSLSWVFSKGFHWWEYFITNLPFRISLILPATISLPANKLMNNLIAWRDVSSSDNSPGAFNSDTFFQKTMKFLHRFFF